MKLETFNILMFLVDKVENLVSDISVRTGGMSFQDWKDAGEPSFNSSEHDRDGL